MIAGPNIRQEQIDEIDEEIISIGSRDHRYNSNAIDTNTPTDDNIMDSNDQPSSICHVRAIQMYQLPVAKMKIDLPFNLLNGEAVVHHGNSVNGLMVLTNYRLFLQLRESQHHIPLGVIELVEHKELIYLHISCKDARTYRCCFDNNGDCLDWFTRLLKTYTPLKQLEELFSFFYYAWAKEKGDENAVKLESNRNFVYDEETFKKEVERLQFNKHGAWRISSVNKNYTMCQSYPPQLLVPACITDSTLETIAKFRSSRRIPTVVWRHPGNGAVIARCSQPEVGWLGWRSSEDEDLLKAISDACSFDRGPKNMLELASSSPTLSDESGVSCTSDVKQPDKKVNISSVKVLIMDARSYTTAVANRARGGGCECPEYYPACEMQFMSLANIHTIRKSFNNLRQLCMSCADQSNWFSLLEGTQWLQHMSVLMKASITVVRTIEYEGKPVLVHCSDGWDRTPQIVALAELLLDPYYRTVEGFRILVEREWLAFGHKFADRCGLPLGSEDLNERCPVFLQWLDCVHQLVLQFPCAFEFSHTFLVKLAQHTYSNLFGTFLCNRKKERVERVNDHTFSVWSFLNSPWFKNHLYAPPPQERGPGTVLWPQCNVRDLQVWTEVYLGSLEMQNVETGSKSLPNPPEPISNQMTKTRSYGDLACATDPYLTPNRRKSDPSIAVDMKLKGLHISTTDLPQDDLSSEQSQEKTPIIFGTSSDFSNGHISNENLNGSDNCNNDCIYNLKNQLLSDDSVDLLDSANMEYKNGSVCFDENKIIAQGKKLQNGVKKKNDNIDNHLQCSDELDHDGVLELSRNVISKQKTDMANEKDLVIETQKNDFESVSFQPVQDIPNNHLQSDIINHNGNLIEVEEETDDVEEDKVDGFGIEVNENKIDVTIIRNGFAAKPNFSDSVETSTDTLTSEKIIESSLTKEINGFDKDSNPDIFNGNIEFCKVCAQNFKLINSKFSYNSNNTSGKNSRYSTPPLYSRTPSGNGWENTLNSLGQHRNPHLRHCRLGDDGLIPLRSDMQDRLWQIIEEQNRKEEALQRELQTYREALIKHLHHQCNLNEGDRLDDACDSNEDDGNSSISKSSESSTNDNLRNEFETSSSQEWRRSSVVDSVCSAGEGQMSAVESLRSDISWEAVEERPASVELGVPTTLWVPDHAVSKCTGCQNQFWIGRRKHHCRKCGRIFCAECSENSTPVPSEQLYSPVRVCTTCYSKLRRDCGEIPDRCKHIGPQTTNTNPRITASSN